MDKLRILERMTLKHKNTGKWAKQRMLRAKHDPHVRDALMNQLELSKKLTQKVNHPSDDEEEDSSASDGDSAKEENVLGNSSILENGDQKDVSLSPDKAMVIEDALLDCDTLKGTFQSRRDSEVRKKLKRKLKLIDEENANENSSTDIHYREERPLIAGQPGLHYTDNHRFEEEETLIEESLERKQTVKDFDISGEEQCEEKNESSLKTNSNSSKRSRKKKQKQKENNSAPEEDSENVINVETVTLKSAVPDISRTGEESLDDSSDNDEKVNIQEAFQDDELFDQFRQEKHAIIEKDKPKPLNLFLPGWGSWAGPGIKVPRRKKKRFIIKPSPPKPRKDSMLGNVIINEKQDEKLKKHQVREVPFPFSVQQFESSIRQPIGNTWNPETAFQRLIAPKVVTQLGKVIDPIDDSALVKK